MASSLAICATPSLVNFSASFLTTRPVSIFATISAFSLLNFRLPLSRFSRFLFCQGNNKVDADVKRISVGVLERLGTLEKNTVISITWPSTNLLRELRSSKLIYDVVYVLT